MFGEVFIVQFLFTSGAISKPRPAFTSITCQARA